MEKSIKFLGQQHSSALMDMTNLALTYQNSQGPVKNSEELGVQLMEMSASVFEEEHPYSLSSMANLAHTWMQQSRNEEAVSLMEKCFRLRRHVLDSDHRQTESSRKTLNEWKGENRKIGL